MHPYAHTMTGWGLALALVLCQNAHAANATRAPASQTGKPAIASATMPLEAYLELYERSNVAQPARQKRAPVSALIARAELKGKLTDDAILFSAHMTVNVLDATEWVTVPLLNLTNGTVIEQMPQVDRAHFAVNGKRLEFLSKRRGRFDFKFRFIERASAENDTRKVSLELAAPALSQCRIQFDRSFFELSETDYRRHGDDAVVFPEDGHCNVTWARRESVVSANDRQQEAPDIAPVVTAAHASVVATMEGDRVLRALYKLRFSGPQQLAIKLGPAETLSRLFLNGHAIAAKQQDDEIVVQVHPSDAGDADATLELVTVSEGHTYLLKGEQHIALPSLSWPTNVLNLKANLPAVFNYTWRAGTLAPVDAQPDVVFTHRIPTPGKSLHFRRYLVSKQTAEVRLDYDVDLKGQYFTGN